jgi:hypothetical protein
MHAGYAGPWLILFYVCFFTLLEVFNYTSNRVKKYFQKDFHRICSLFNRLRLLLKALFVPVLPDYSILSG